MKEGGCGTEPSNEPNGTKRERARIFGGGGILGGSEIDCSLLEALAKREEYKEASVEA